VATVNELEKLLTEKVGLSPEQAQKAVTTMMGFLKEKLPGPLGAHLDSLTGTGAGAATGSGGAAGLMGEAEGLLKKF
jgi:hypothetical protein